MTNFSHTNYAPLSTLAGGNTYDWVMQNSPPSTILPNASYPHIQVVFTLGFPTSPFAETADGSVVRDFPRRTESFFPHPSLPDLLSCDKRNSRLSLFLFVDQRK
jgi:hypothetical protein